MSRSFDCVIIGLGGAGSAASYFLARRGARVLGLEQFEMNHVQGSSHGRTRITRSAYWEGPAYIPLLQRGWSLWREVEHDSGQSLLRANGVLMIGPADGPVVAGARASARKFDLPVELLEPNVVADRFPVFRLGQDEVALFDPKGGTLFPELCVQTFVAGAERAGAELHFRDPVRSWNVVSDGVEVTTEHGRYHAAQLVLTAGAWTARLAQWPLPLEVSRQVVGWFDPPRAGESLTTPERMPNFLWERDGTDACYGVADFGDGPKVGYDAGTTIARPEDADRRIRREELAPMERFVDACLPSMRGSVREARTCLYTRTPDRSFIIGRHPAHPPVLLVSACSGHGFKFTGVLGTIVADLLLDGKTSFDLSAFAPTRFRSSTG